MTFTGRAIYDTDIFNGVAEDVADLISMISPFETPLLDRLAQPERPASNVLHEWLQDQLAPNTVVTSNALGATGTCSLAIHDGSGNPAAPYLQVGAVLKVKTTGEYMQVTAISGNDITATRAFGGTSATTAAAASELFVISDAALEGADVSEDTSRPRSRISNYCQIFKKDIIISGTVRAVSNIGVSDEMEYQKMKKLREAIRDLEKAVIQGRSSTNTLGSSSAYRTMKGLWQFLSTNSYSTGTLTESWLGNIIQSAWDNGASDLNVIIADANYKRIIDSWNTTNKQIANQDTAVRNLTSLYESTFGVMEVVLGRWLPDNSLMVISTDRVKVVPLQGRSFAYTPVSKTGDSEKGMVIGEYTLEVMNEEGMAKAYGA